GGGVYVAADVHYLACGGARAAAVTAADAAFIHLVADRVRLVPGVESYQPGQFYLRELPALRAVLDGLTEMALLVVDGCRPGPGRPARPGRPRSRRVRRPGDRRREVSLPDSHPRHPGVSRSLGAPAVCHSGRDAPDRRRRLRPAHGRPVPD